MLTAYGSASTLMKKRYVPPCWTPNRKCTSIVLPLVNPPPGNVTVTVLLRPPPPVCAGGCSSTVPLTVRLPRLVEMAKSLPVNKRISASPGPPFGPAVMSTARKRNLVTVAPVVFLNRRRMSSVPKVQLLGPTPPLQTFAVLSRTRLGTAVEGTCGSLGLGLIVALRWIGEAEFSGPRTP